MRAIRSGAEGRKHGEKETKNQVVVMSPGCVGKYGTVWCVAFAVDMSIKHQQRAFGSQPFVEPDQTMRLSNLLLSVFASSISMYNLVARVGWVFLGTRASG